MLPPPPVLPELPLRAASAAVLALGVATGVASGGSAVAAPLGPAAAPAAGRAAQPWRDADWVVWTPGPPPGLPGELAGHVDPVAVFGTGAAAVEIARVRTGARPTAAQQRRELAARRAVGADLLHNPNLRMSPEVRRLVAAGRLDPRALILLPRAATLGRLDVTALPLVRGESDQDRPRRQVLITGRDDTVLINSDVAQLTATFTQQDPRYRAAAVTPSTGSLLVTWSVDCPNGLLP